MEVQRCELKFGSWVYNALQLDLLNVSQFIIKPKIMIDCPLINSTNFVWNLKRIDSMDLEGYNPNSQWDLESASVERHETVYECCPEPFVDITYVVKFHKKDSWILG